MKWLLVKLPLRILSVLLLSFFAWQLLMFFRPRPPEYTSAEQKALAQAMDRFLDESVSTLDSMESSNGRMTHAATPWRVGVAHLLNDPRDSATDILRECVRNNPRLELHEGSVLKKFLADVGHAVANATSLEEIALAGQKVELDLVLAGRVKETRLLPQNSASATIDLLAWDTQRGSLLLNKTTQALWEPSLSRQTEMRLRGLPRMQRVFIWLFVILAAPWLTAFATHRTLEKKSNAASFLLVFGYTVFGTALAVYLNRTQPGADGFWLHTFGAMLVTAIYSFWACERIASKA